MDLIIGILGVAVLVTILLWPSSKKAKTTRETSSGTIKARGDFSCDVVGESHYQDALERIVGGRAEDSAMHKCVAHIIPEPTNRHDVNAMRVDIDGMTVGYLSRKDAVTLRKRLREQGVDGPVSASALIVGGWDRGRDDVGSFGVRLDVPMAK